MPEESEIEIRQVFEAEDFGPAQSESEHKAFMDECFAYHDELRKNGHIVGGEALQIARNVQGASRPDAWNQIDLGPWVGGLKAAGPLSFELDAERPRRHSGIGLNGTNRSPKVASDSRSISRAANCQRL